MEKKTKPNNTVRNVPTSIFQHLSFGQNYVTYKELFSIEVNQPKKVTAAVAIKLGAALREILSLTEADISWIFFLVMQKPQ